MKIEDAILYRGPRSLVHSSIDFFLLGLLFGQALAGAGVITLLIALILLGFASLRMWEAILIIQGVE